MSDTTNTPTWKNKFVKEVKSFSIILFLVFGFRSMFLNHLGFLRVQ